MVKWLCMRLSNNTRNNSNLERYRTFTSKDCHQVGQWIGVLNSETCPKEKTSHTEGPPVYSDHSGQVQEPLRQYYWPSTLDHLSIEAMNC